MNDQQQKLEGLISGYSINHDDAEWLRAITQPKAQQHGNLQIQKKDCLSRWKQQQQPGDPSGIYQMYGAFVACVAGARIPGTYQSWLGARLALALPDDVLIDLRNKAAPNDIPDSAVFGAYQEHQQPQTQQAAAVPAIDEEYVERLRVALRFYARGEHYFTDDNEDFDTVSGEPDNWLSSGLDDSQTMIENGSVAKFALLGKPLNFMDGGEDLTPQPIEGELHAAPAPVLPLSDEDVFTLIGHAKSENLSGKVDMPRYFMSLAERIASTINDKSLSDRCKELAAGITAHGAGGESTT